MDTTANIFPPNPKQATGVSVEPTLNHMETAASSEEAGQYRRVVEFDYAIARTAASFAQLAASIFFSREKFNGDPLDRSLRQQYIAPLTEAFEKAHGAITDSYYCQQVIAGAVLTDRQELWIVHPSVDPHVAPIAEQLFECDRLNIEADRVLAGPERLKELQSTKTLIYSVVAHLLSLLDSPTQLPRSILDLLRREVKHAREYYLRAAGRHAQFDYFRGMIYGIAVGLGLTVVSASVWAQLVPDLSGSGKALLGCLTAGGFGAVVSVMSRMTFGELSVDYEAGRRLLTMLGAFRPVIGMVLGAAIWVLAASGVLAVGPSDSAKVPFFHILIAFLAGFSERWAQDMLGRAAYQVSGSGPIGKGKKGDAERIVKATANAMEGHDGSARP